MFILKKHATIEPPYALGRHHKQTSVATLRTLDPDLGRPRGSIRSRIIISCRVHPPYGGELYGFLKVVYLLTVFFNVFFANPREIFFVYVRMVNGNL